jgi:creatinine amidohydrolase
MPYLGGAIGRYRPPAGMFDDSFAGIWGDPGLASAEVGEKVYALITDWIVQVVKQDLAQNGRARSAGVKSGRARRS